MWQMFATVLSKSANDAANNGIGPNRYEIPKERRSDGRRVERGSRGDREEREAVGETGGSRGAVGATGGPREVV